MRSRRSRSTNLRARLVGRAGPDPAVGVAADSEFGGWTEAESGVVKSRIGAGYSQFDGDHDRSGADGRTTRHDGAITAHVADKRTRANSKPETTALSFRTGRSVRFAAPRCRRQKLPSFEDVLASSLLDYSSGASLRLSPSGGTSFGRQIDVPAFKPKQPARPEAEWRTNGARVLHVTCVWLPGRLVTTERSLDTELEEECSISNVCVLEQLGPAQDLNIEVYVSEPIEIAKTVRHWLKVPLIM